MKTSVVVPAYNAADTIGACLEPLRDADVVVVDDGSSDDTAGIAERAGARVVRTDRVGPAAARNAGAAAADGELLAFTDADCVPQPGWLDAGNACIAEGAELVQGAVRPASPPGPFDRYVSVGAEIGLYETANLFVRRSLFERVGGFEMPFPVELGIHFGEDIWFAWRARRLGARTAFCAGALVEHAVFPRDAAGWLAELRRRRYFPAIAALVPELRDTFFHGRFFLNERSARFDLALLGVAATALTRSPLPLLAAIPYTQELRATRVGVVEVAGDFVTLAALVRGSVAARSLVI